MSTRHGSRRLRLVVLLLTVVLATGACSGNDDQDVDAGAPGDPQPGIPDGESDYAGEVTSVTAFEPVTEDCVDPTDADPDGSVSSDDPPFCSDPDNSPSGHVLVEEFPGEQRGQKISLRVEPGTVILSRAGEADARAVDFEALAVGARVEVWVSGPVAESYPEQGAADVIVISS